ncbi:MAG: methionine adenosyltransferase [Firmicutes bacterium]|nr:methionine adenosyltransferase [Bacillota bacterium]
MRKMEGIECLRRKQVITSESVNIGHPDKTCDVIADSFLDEALRQDPNAQMAVECAIKDDLLMIYGEATTTAKIDYQKIARGVLKDIGYTNEFQVVEKISKQSPEINKAVVKKDELTANDQGIVYGYATNETPEYMPLPIIMAHKLMKRYEEFRHGHIGSNESLIPGPASRWFYADAKSQVSIEYDGNNPIAVHTILVSVSHSPSISCSSIYNLVQKNVVDTVLPEYPQLDTKNTKIIINPSGAFTIWGSFSDSGCVGRKIVVDTYGGVGRVGGGCFSSKNATKVDRSGAYYARYVAKNIVANKMADKCEVSVSYAIGLSDPLKLNIETFGTHKVPAEKIYQYVEQNFDFSPSNIIRELDLLKPIYKQTACFGHFGREGFPWEFIKK